MGQGSYQDVRSGALAGGAARPRPVAPLGGSRSRPARRVARVGQRTRRGRSRTVPDLGPTLPDRGSLPNGSCRCGGVVSPRGPERGHKR